MGYVIGIIIGLILLVVIGYYGSVFITALVISIVGNGLILLGNLFIFLWYLLQNAWAYIVIGVGYLDYIVCFLPFNPIVNWGIFGGILGFVISFLISIKGRRRSYLRLNLIFSSTAILLLIALAIASTIEHKAFAARENTLYSDEKLTQGVINPRFGTYIRSGPNNNAPQLVKLPKGTGVFVESEEKGFYKVKYNSLGGIVNGYVQKSFVNMKIPPVIYGRGIVKGEAVIRSGPSTRYSKVTIAPKGTQLIILSKDNSWFKVRYKSGNREVNGYVAKSLIEVSSTATVAKESKKGTTSPRASASKKKLKEKKTAPPRASISHRRTITVKLLGGATMEMVWIKPGTFRIGSPSSETGQGSDEGPQHKVTITKGFWLGKYEITQGQWERVMGTRLWKGKNHVRENSNYPAVYISWNDMQNFVAKLNRAKGSEVYRLPTEAEWEYACRAGTRTWWSFGNAAKLKFGKYAWFRANASNMGEEYAHRVGTKHPNPWGLYDMHGNVWEWVQDRYGAYSGRVQTDPTGPATGSSHVIRGGSFYNSAQGVRSANRHDYSPDGRGDNIGSRLVRQGQ